MSLNEILSSALSGLGAAQAGIRTVSNNIANVNTPGYARERVTQTTDVINGQVVGVTVGEPTRVADRYLEAAVNGRAGEAGRAEVTSDYLDRLQGLLGAPGAESGLSGRLDAIMKSATVMTGSAGSVQGNAVFVADVTDAIGTIRGVMSDVAGLRADADGEISGTVERTNALLRQVHDLNETIARAGVTGRSAGGAADQRTSAIEELGGLIGIVAREQPDGRMTIDTLGGVQLVDRRLRQLSYPQSTGGTSQPTYPTIEIRFADEGLAANAATGDTIESSTIGGRLGGLLDLRDLQLPAVARQLETVFGGMAQALNAASNAATAVPPPATLEGRATALTTGDRLGFTGKATFAKTDADGRLLASATIDFSGMATLGDALAAVNTQLGAGTATFANGKLTLSAGAGNGMTVMQDGSTPSSRAGVGFSQYFGLNDLIVSETSTLVPSGMTTADPHGFAPPQATEFALRDSGGRLVSKYSLTPAAGGTFGDLITTLNASPMAGYGTFALQSSGRIAFVPSSANAGASVTVLSDTTDRSNTGVGLAEITGLRSDTRVLDDAEVRRDIVTDPGRLPLAQLQSVAIGERALGANDRSGAPAYVDAMGKRFDLGGLAGTNSVAGFTATTLGSIGTAASRAKSVLDETQARRDEAIARRDNFSGVSIDEELAQLVVLQNSYSASARIMTTASSMYDTLLGMVD